MTAWICFKVMLTKRATYKQWVCSACTRRRKRWTRTCACSSGSTAIVLFSTVGGCGPSEPNSTSNSTRATQRAARNRRSRSTFRVTIAARASRFSSVTRVAFRWIDPILTSNPRLVALINWHSFRSSSVNDFLTLKKIQRLI